MTSLYGGNKHAKQTSQIAVKWSPTRNGFVQKQYVCVWLEGSKYRRSQYDTNLRASPAWASWETW